MLFCGPCYDTSVVLSLLAIRCWVPPVSPETRYTFTNMDVPMLNACHILLQIWREFSDWVHFHKNVFLCGRFLGRSSVLLPSRKRTEILVWYLVDEGHGGCNKPFLGGRGGAFLLCFGKVCANSLGVCFTLIFTLLPWVFLSIVSISCLTNHPLIKTRIGNRSLVGTIGCTFVKDVIESIKKQEMEVY